MTASREDGEVQGSITHRARVAGLTARVDVTCFTIEGGRAWVAGDVKGGNLHQDPGFGQAEELAYVFEDNSGPKGEPADRATVGFVGFEQGFADDFCQNTPDKVDLPLEAGDIRIQPAG